LYKIDVFMMIIYKSIDYQDLVLDFPSEEIKLLPSEEIRVSFNSLALPLFFTLKIRANTTMLIMLKLASTIVKM